MRTLLPFGTIINYIDELATVIEDNGMVITVYVHAFKQIEEWQWEFSGHTCKVMPDSLQKYDIPNLNEIIKKHKLDCIIVKMVQCMNELKALI